MNVNINSSPKITSCHAGIVLLLNTPNRHLISTCLPKPPLRAQLWAATKWTLVLTLVLMARNTLCFHIPECFSQLSDSSHHQPGSQLYQ